MRYACLIYLEGGKDFDQFIVPQLDFDDTLRESGHHELSFALEPVGAATSVRVRNGRTTMTDGPFAETKEVLGGLYVIEAKDLDEAIAVAARIPLATVGTIEVRPLRELSRT